MRLCQAEILESTYWVINLRFVYFNDKIGLCGLVRLQHEEENDEMKQKLRGILIWLLMTCMIVCGVVGCNVDNQTLVIMTSAAAFEVEEMEVTEETVDTITETGFYTSKEDVADYIYMFQHLPDNFITKKEAEALGWNNKEGNLWAVAPGMSIGGGRFGNYEERLPDADGRKYYECDIDYDGGYRNEKRIVYSNDGLIFYTEDHYESFEQLY